MRALTMDELTFRELTAEEVQQISGGFTTFGAALVLGGTLAGIAGVVIGVIGAPIWVVLGGVVAIGGLAAGGLAYAYDAGSEYQQHLPQGTVTIGELSPTNTNETYQLDDTTNNLDTTSNVNTAITTAESDWATITHIDEMDFSGG